MDDIRDTRPWFWILVLVLFGVALAGLLVAISAKNSSVDEGKVVRDATAQIKEELAGLNGALKAASAFQQESDELQRQVNRSSARERARLKRAVADAVTGAKGQLHKLSSRIASLETQMTEAQKTDAKLQRSQGALAEEIVRINRRLRNLSGNGGASGP
jgi:chromosome segregation ATPase